MLITFQYEDIIRILIEKCGLAGAKILDKEPTPRTYHAVTSFVSNSNGGEIADGTVTITIDTDAL